MALVVNTNMQSLNALNNLNRTNHALGNVFERLSSGLRINKAADDAAGLGVSQKLDAEYRTMRQAERNANDGISLIQTAEGAASEVGNILKRMKELATQSSSETLGSAERSFIQNEFSQLSAEVNRIANVTEFNGIQLSDGSMGASGLAVQVGGNDSANDRINITMGDLRASQVGVSTGDISLNSAGSAQAALTALDNAISSVNAYRSDFGAIQNRLESTIRNLQTYTENIAGAKSRILDADFAFETAQLAKYQILQQSGVAVLGQSNAVNQAALSLLG